MAIEYDLAYDDAEELARALNIESLKPRDRLKVRLSGHTDYELIYMGSPGDQITGISSLNGRMVIIDIGEKKLYEHTHHPDL